MRLVLITGFTPTRDNFRGPSALMYHLLLHRRTNDTIKIYTTNHNQVSISEISNIKNELNADIIILKDSLYNHFHKRSKCAEVRIKLGIDKYYATGNYRLTKSILSDIASYSPDIIWVYSEEYTAIIKQLAPLYKVHIWGYDCFPLHFNRLMSDEFIYRDNSEYERALVEYKWTIFAEKQLADVKCTYSDVGIKDRNMFEVITGRKDAKFYPHPHYTVNSKIISFNNKKLSILISGKLDQYTWTDTKKLIELLSLQADLKIHYSITFLGKGWTSSADVLRNAGYEVVEKEWVEFYADEVINHDIQIFPISVGSGTKGKVLDALSMGILCIGSEIAMENIYVRSRHSCFQYKDISEVPNLLIFISQHREICAKIAENGRSQVLKWHNPERIMKLIADDLLCNKPFNFIGEYMSEVKSLNPII